jgi:hypothetical protein
MMTEVHYRILAEYVGACCGRGGDNNPPGSINNDFFWAN